MICFWILCFGASQFQGKHVLHMFEHSNRITFCFFKTWYPLPIRRSYASCRQNPMAFVFLQLQDAWVEHYQPHEWNWSDSFHFWDPIGTAALVGICCVWHRDCPFFGDAPSDANWGLDNQAKVLVHLSRGLLTQRAVFVIILQGC